MKKNIDILDVNARVAIAFGIALIVFILVYLAFFR